MMRSMPKSVNAWTRSSPTPKTQMAPHFRWRRRAAVVAKVLCDLGDGGDVMDFVDVKVHAARADNDDAGMQFEGRSSSGR
ncbi:hypothetical protein [Bradyrhizobium ottawaense]|uniref:hypothetical protein n=1 Tax=Bradyrhizobium ottawaense TaxID=931866 RepID=UPI00384B6FD2